MSNINKQKQERAKLIADGRKVLDLAESEKRNLTAEENTSYDAIFDKIDELGKTIERGEKQLDLDRSAALAVSSTLETEERKGGDVSEDREALLLSAARSFINGTAGDPRAAEELRALQVGSDIEGGYLVMPEQLATTLIKAVDDNVVIRQLATVIPVPNAQSLGAVALDNDPDDADWTTELKTGSLDDAMRFGKRHLTPHPMAKRIKISNDLLRVGAMSPESLVLDRLAYKFGITQEKGFMTGNGAQQALGLFTASNDGISTSQDVSTDNTTTAITFDGLKNAFYSLKANYQGSGSWLFHRDAIKMLSKIKDGNGQYIWQAAVVAGSPDMIQGRPVIISEYVPNTFTTGLYVGMFGDFSNYWIADAMNLQFQRLGELYAETNQTGFIGRLSSDGMPVLQESFARITLA